MSGVLSMPGETRRPLRFADPPGKRSLQLDLQSVHPSAAGLVMERMPDVGCDVDEESERNGRHLLEDLQRLVGPEEVQEVLSMPVLGVSAGGGKKIHLLGRHAHGEASWPMREPRINFGRAPGSSGEPLSPVGNGFVMGNTTRGDRGRRGRRWKGASSRVGEGVPNNKWEFVVQ